MTESPEALRHAHSCSALDTGPHMMISSPGPDTKQHMQVHAKLLIHVETCVQSSALNTGQHLKMIHQLSINAERCQTLNTHKHMQAHSPLLIRSNARSHTLSPHLIRADTCTHALHSGCRQTNKDIRSALNMCRYMHTHAQLLRHMQTHTQRSTQETE